MKPLVVLDEVYNQLCDELSPVRCVKETLRRNVNLSARLPGHYVETTTDRTVLKLLADHKVIGAQAPHVTLLSYPTLLYVLQHVRKAPDEWMAPLLKVNLPTLFISEAGIGRTPVKANPFSRPFAPPPSNNDPPHKKRSFPSLFSPRSQPSRFKGMFDFAPEGQGFVATDDDDAVLPPKPATLPPPLQEYEMSTFHVSAAMMLKHAPGV
jgi:hypothetical protein